MTVRPTARYNYKKPRAVNWVSVLLFLITVSAAYLGWKFVPVFYQREEVDSALADLANQGLDMARYSADARADKESKLIARTYQRLQRLGVDDPSLVVYFSPDYAYLHADYSVVIEHPLDQKTILPFQRKAKVPVGVPGGDDDDY
jgi:hypothetical protein